MAEKESTGLGHGESGKNWGRIKQGMTELQTRAITRGGQGQGDNIDRGGGGGGCGKVWNLLLRTLGKKNGTGFRRNWGEFRDGKDQRTAKRISHQLPEKAKNHVVKGGGVKKKTSGVLKECF